MIDLNEINYNELQSQANTFYDILKRQNKSDDDALKIKVIVNVDDNIVSVGESLYGISCHVKDLLTLKDWLPLRKIDFQKGFWQGKIKDYENMVMI